MSIETSILSSSDVESALLTLKAIQTYSRAKRVSGAAPQEHRGINRVDVYIEDVDGDWLEQWETDDSGDSRRPATT